MVNGCVEWNALGPEKTAVVSFHLIGWPIFAYVTARETAYLPLSQDTTT